LVIKKEITMATITEDYVSFEIAKLLKEKGFDEGCRARYGTAGSFSYEKYEVEASGCEMHNAILAPTLQMAMKWLRIEHNIHIEPHIVKTRYSYGYMPNFIDLKKLKPYFPFDADGFDFSNADKYVCITYDKACEVAIKYCLEHLI
jgi:hypothetical protein